MDNMNLKPLSDRVIVEPLERAEVTALGIVLPETAKEKPQIGKVVAVGPGQTLDNGKIAKMSVKKNDEVIYAKYMGSEVEIDEKKYVILREKDVLGIVEK